MLLVSFILKNKFEILNKHIRQRDIHKDEKTDASLTV